MAAKAKGPPKPRKKVVAVKGKPTAAARLDQIGINAICERIAGGEADGEIAASLEMDRMSLNNWLNTPANAIISARAREESAEAWLDKGLATIATALPKAANIDAGAARAYAQECARRAAIRNSRYRDKVDVVADVTIRDLSDEQLREKAVSLAAKVGITSSNKQ